MKRVSLLLGMAAAVAFGGMACAQGDYPNQMVRIVVPFSAGSITDGLSRILADKLSTVWKQQVIVENRAGLAGHDQRREVDARRLHPDPHVQRAHHRGRDQQEPPVRSGEGFRRRQPGRRRADGDDRAAHSPADAEGVSPDGEGQARAAQFLLRRVSPAPRFSRPRSCARARR